MLKTFAVIGDPIDHSLSPNIHNAAYRNLNLECTYIAYRVPKNELESGIQSLKSINISGFNVTIPHKIEIMKFLDDTDEVCQMIGAANTIVNDDGRLIGYNTDIDGFLEPIKNREISLIDSNILLLGAGGASRAIIAGIKRENGKRITRLFFGCNGIIFDPKGSSLYWLQKCRCFFFELTTPVSYAVI